jgi:cell division protein FtsW
LSSASFAADRRAGSGLARWIAPPTRPLEDYARIAVGAALALMALGVLMVYSASSTKAGLRYDDPELFLRRQLVWVVMGVATLYFTMRADPERLRPWARPAGIAVIVLLALVLIPGVGTMTNGARRWFRFQSLSFQPSEFAKLAAILWLAHHLDVARDKLHDWKQGVLPVVVPLGLAAGLTLIEPDFGTALFLCAVASAVMLVGGVPTRKLAWCSLAALPLVAWQVVDRWEVMKKRLAGMGGGEARSDATHQVFQAKIAMGSGGLAGVGVGAGHQKLLYLPEAHTDFILGVIGEELGFVGTALVIALFCVVTWCGFRIAMGCAARSRFSFLLVFGSIFMIGLQAAGNIAVVTGSVPTKGIALPFVSLGGSSLLVLCASLGLVYAVARRHDAVAAASAPAAGGVRRAADAPLAPAGVP